MNAGESLPFDQVLNYLPLNGDGPVPANVRQYGAGGMLVMA